LVRTIYGLDFAVLRSYPAIGEGIELRSNLSMLKTIGMLILMLFASFVGLSQEESSQKLFPVKVDNKCGYINQQGKIIVPPRFDFCNVFSEGLAGVSIEEKYGYIDESGKIVIPLRFDSFFPESFSEGIAPIKLRNQSGKVELGYVDKSGSLKLLQGVSEIDSFYEGLASVQKNGKYGYIDRNMKFVIPPIFDFVRSFADGRAWISDKLGNEFYIDTSGRKVITKFGTNGSDFSEGLATFNSKYSGYGYIDTNGKVAIKQQFNHACLFKEELACVENYDGKWGYINKSGNFSIPPQYSVN